MMGSFLQGAKQSLGFLSWNVNGLRVRRRQRLILQYLKNSSASILLIQETHLLQTECKALFGKLRWVDKVIASDQLCCSKGAAIILKSNAGIDLIKSLVDDRGRWVVAEIKSQGSKYTLVSFYGPNEDDVGPLNNLCFALADFESPLIMGGDFNVLLDNRLDRSSPRTLISAPRVKAHLLSMLKNLNLSDVWRKTRGETREYSFYSKKNSHYSRIDYIFMDHSELDKVSLMEYLPILISDHGAIALNVDLPQAVPLRRWTLNRRFLLQPTTPGFLKSETVSFLQNNLGSTSLNIVWDSFNVLLLLGNSSDDLSTSDTPDLFF